MSDYFYCYPSKYGNTYPPVDSDSIKQTENVSNWQALPNTTQTRNRIQAGSQVYAEDFCYGFITADKQTSAINLKINGESKQTISATSAYVLPADTVIFGYSVTPTYVDLWTRSDYRDESSEVMYGRRGLRVTLSTFNDWDTSSKNGFGKVTRRCILHAFNNNALNITKEIENETATYKIAVTFSGNFAINGSDTEVFTPLKGALVSEVISTLELEAIVHALQSQLTQIEHQISSIQKEVDRIIPTLTTTINYETSRLYASR